MLHLLRNRRFSEVVLVAAILTGVAGAILFWRDTNGLQLALMTQPGGLGFTVGGVAGGTALLLFLFVGYPAGRRMIVIGDRLEAERRAPSEDEQRILAASQRTLNRLGAVVLVLLVAAAAAMATARYWPLIL
jgi:amino acid transporter